MREKDHSPRKMLPSPKQGAVYPLLGLGSTLPAPFDLSLVNRSSSSNLLHQQQQQHQSLTEQPLDLRVERKKSSVGGGTGGGGGGGTSTSTSSDDETDPPRASSTDSKAGSNVDVIYYFQIKFISISIHSFSAQRSLTLLVKVRREEL